MNKAHIFPGYYPLFDRFSGYDHLFGGPNTLGGAMCINCAKPLMLHLTLDTNDPRLFVRPLRVPTLCLLYCSHCALSWEPFSYQMIDGLSIKQIAANLGETDWEGFYEDCPHDVFPTRNISLLEIPDRLQQINDLLNADLDLSESEISEYSKLRNQLSGRADQLKFVEEINQIGGRAFLIQGLPDPLCPNCCPDHEEREKFYYGSLRAHRMSEAVNHPSKMFFLAALTNDSENSIVIGPPGYQVVFFLCLKCLTIEVRSSID